MKMLTIGPFLCTLLALASADFATPNLGNWLEIDRNAPCDFATVGDRFILNALGYRAPGRDIVGYSPDYSFGKVQCFGNKYVCYSSWNGAEHSKNPCYVLLKQDRTASKIGTSIPNFQWITVTELLNNPNQYTPVMQTYPSGTTASPFTYTSGGQTELLGTVGRYENVVGSGSVAYLPYNGREIVIQNDELFNGKVLVIAAIGKRVLIINDIDTSGVVSRTSPGRVYTETITNGGSTPIVTTYTRKYQKEEGTKIATTLGIKSGLEMEVSAEVDVEIAKIGVKTTLNLESSFTYESEQWTVVTSSDTYSRQITIPPQKIYSVTLTTYTTNVNMPFKASEIVYATDDTTELFRLDRSGVFENVYTDVTNFSIQEVNITDKNARANVRILH